jgi:hypothetical protein
MEFLGGLREFGKALIRARPSKDPSPPEGDPPPPSFQALFPLFSYLVLLLVCWKAIDWLFPTHWVFSLGIAVLLARFIQHFFFHF